MPDGVMAVILAAGEGKRMKSKLPKVMHQVCGRPMLEYVLAAAREAGVTKTIVVIGPGGEVIKETLGEGVEYAYQRERLGTGHAVLQAADMVPPEVETLLVLSGDTPTLPPRLLQELLALHHKRKAAASLVITRLEDPKGYGRVLRNGAGKVLGIVEEADADPAVKTVKEINAGVYAFDRRELFGALDQISPANVQGEYYLPDVLGIFCKQGLPVVAVTADYEEIQGVNNRVQLAAAEGVIRRGILEALMLAGVTIVDPASTFIDAGVEIGRDTVIHPFTIIKGASRIGDDCSIGPMARLTGVTAADGVGIENSVLLDCRLGAGVKVGPYAYLRPGTILEEGAKAGTFVEIKNSTIGKNSKVPHQSYVGDTIMAGDVNIGAGTITCNYDGWDKYITHIEEGAFIGSNTNLVAPVRIGKKAVTGAGSTISKDVPAYALGLERARQKIVSDYMKKKMREKGCEIED
ncbi:MAG: bifunctional UDP-N-acetylglucosamine diphosphorylase/glucosamine-1-phosphate N-acetyltransferase GlmU [Firmicutes bacterium]|nr:bifunctional UDP-N-acetylglucosamine diphosphorylase/glucosamine-1-phosphate N-acetyltransferase GlmU [Bacillota bacterium]